MCPVCGEITTNGNFHKICEKIFAPPSGIRCKKMRKGMKSLSEPICSDCKDRDHLYDRHISAFEYNEFLKRTIYQFKYENQKWLADTFAKKMWKECSAEITGWNIDAIVPVPMSEKKARSRGYNQAALLALSIGRYSRIPVDCNYLRRITETSPMKELTDIERMYNIKNAFKTEGNKNYKNILIVDDIYTTGITLSECARTRKSAGVSGVFGLTVCIGAGF